MLHQATELDVSCLKVVSWLQYHYSASNKGFSLSLRIFTVSGEKEETDVSFVHHRPQNMLHSISTVMSDGKYRRPQDTTRFDFSSAAASTSRLNVSFYSLEKG